MAAGSCVGPDAGQRRRLAVQETAPFFRDRPNASSGLPLASTLYLDAGVLIALQETDVPCSCEVVYQRALLLEALTVITTDLSRGGGEKKQVRVSVRAGTRVVSHGIFFSTLDAKKTSLCFSRKSGRTGAKPSHNVWNDEGKTDKIRSECCWRSAILHGDWFKRTSAVGVLRWSVGISLSCVTFTTQILANVTVALAAMGVGALGLPLDLSNLVGGLMVLLLASFGRFLLNGTRIPLGERRGDAERELVNGTRALSAG